MTASIAAEPGTALAGQPRSLRLLLGAARHIRLGELAVVLPSGQRLELRGPEPGPRAEFRIRNPRVARRLLLGGSAGFGESYMDGDWDSPDVAALLELADRNWDAIGRAVRPSRLATLAKRAWHALNANTRRGSRRNIRHHYDLGNAFYERWLDPTMTYSSAVFAGPDQALSEAQTNKYRTLAEKLALAPGQRVLEIGCGWGGFAGFIAREYGVRVTAITVSKAQHEFAAARVQREGLGERVETRLIDYRDVQERFDRVASIEMLEAVGEKYWPAYFGKVRECLVPGGRAGIQVITIADRWYESYRRSVDFIQRYIFPGGMLPSPSVLAEQAKIAGLAIDRQEFFALHYARTLRIWTERFQSAWPDISAMGFDERFRRMWRFYLAYCEAGFRSGSIDVTQVALVRP